MVSPTASAPSASVRSGRRMHLRALATTLVCGLVRFKPSRTRTWLILELGEQSHADRRPDGLLGQAVAVVTIAAGEGRAAPFRLLVRLAPTRALPVPFWRNNFLPEPATSARPRVLTVPTRRAARCISTTSCSSCLLIFAAQISRVDRLLAHLLAGGIVNRYCQHDRQTHQGTGRPGASLVGSRSQSRITPCSSGGWSGSRRWGRARHPSISSRLLAGSTFTTSRLRTVDRTLPCCPGLANPLLGSRRIGAWAGGSRVAVHSLRRRASPAGRGSRAA